MGKDDLQAKRRDCFPHTAIPARVRRAMAAGSMLDDASYICLASVVVYLVPCLLYCYCSIGVTLLCTARLIGCIYCVEKSISLRGRLVRGMFSARLLYTAEHELSCIFSGMNV